MSNIVKYVSLIPVVAYLVYLVGRMYATAYLSQLGVPSILLLEFNDFLFFGTRLESLILIILYSWMFIAFFKYMSYKPRVLFGVSEKHDYKKTDTVGIWLVCIYFFLGVVGIAVSFFSMMANEPPYTTSPIAITLIGLGFPISFSLFILHDKNFIIWMKSKKTLSKFFLIVLLAQLVFFPPTSSTALGALAGFNNYRNLDEVVITTDTPMDYQLLWAKNPDGSYTNAQSLFLIFSNEHFLIVLSGEETINVFNMTNIKAISTNETLLLELYDYR